MIFSCLSVFQIELTFVQATHAIIILFNLGQILLIVSSGIENLAYARRPALEVYMADSNGHTGFLRDLVEASFPMLHILTGTFGTNDEGNFLATIDQIHGKIRETESVFTIHGHATYPRQKAF